MAETRTLSERYAEMARALIESEPALAHLRGCGATICYLSSDRAKRGHGRATLGECERVADKNRWAVPCDFTITVFEPNCEGMDDGQISTLLFHELLHVGVDHDGDGNETYRVRPHDCEDFKLIIDRFGTDWAEPRQ